MLLAFSRASVVFATSQADSIDKRTATSPIVSTCNRANVSACSAQGSNAIGQRCHGHHGLGQRMCGRITSAKKGRKGVNPKVPSRTTLQVQHQTSHSAGDFRLKQASVFKDGWSHKSQRLR